MSATPASQALLFKPPSLDLFGMYCQRPASQSTATPFRWPHQTGLEQIRAKQNMTMRLKSTCNPGPLNDAEQALGPLPGHAAQMPRIVIAPTSIPYLLVQKGAPQLIHGCTGQYSHCLLIQCLSCTLARLGCLSKFLRTVPGSVTWLWQALIEM